MKLYTYIAATFLIVSCNKGTDKKLEKVLTSSSIKELRDFRANVALEKTNIELKLKQLDNAISKLDTTQKTPLVSVFKTSTEKFNHFVEFQGNVSTDKMLILYPEFSGTLNKIYIKEGQQVKKGQLLASIDDGGLSQQINQLEIQKNLSKTTFERQERLWKDNKIGSEIQYLQAKSAYESQIAAVNQAKKQIAKTRITAPFSGIIDEVITEQGTVVSPGMSPVLRIVNLNEMHIETEIPEKYLKDITLNKTVYVEFDYLNKIDTSKVTQASSFIDPANRTYKIKVPLENKDKLVKPNLTTRLRINDYSNNEAILIPQNIISENANGEEYVYVVKSIKDNKGKATKTIIKTGKTEGDVIEVLSGLKNNETIIVEGARSVRNGQLVEFLNN